MPNTTNFNFPTPADTDLVKDGASAIRSLGNSIDSAFVDLKGGTTGQVLTKASNTDLDYSWTSVDPLTILDAKGDLISATAADTPARLPVGTNGQYLSANSSTSTGLEWVAAPTSSQAWSQVGGVNTLTGNSSVTLSGISNANMLMINLVNCSSATSGGWISIHINNDSTGSRYYHYGLGLKSQSTYTTGIFDQYNEGASVPTSGINIAQFNAANKSCSGTVFIYGGNATGRKVFQGQAGVGDTNNGNRMSVFGGYYTQTGLITSISVKYNDGTSNFSDGYFYVYTTA